MKFLLTLITGVASLTWAQTTPDRAEIINVQLFGKGCELTEASANLSPDLKDLSILFDNYVVEIGQGSANPNLIQAQKDCQVTLQISVPQGWQMAFRSVDYRGFVAVPTSAWAFHRFSILSRGQPIASLREATITGARVDTYTVHAEQRPDRMVWTGCEGQIQTVTLLSQLGVAYHRKSTDRSLAQIALDSKDLSIQQGFGVEWRRCNTRPPVVEPPGRGGRGGGGGPIVPTRPPRF